MNAGAISTADVVAGLRALAEDIEDGTRPTPESGRGLRRQAGVPVVPVAIHDALCGWRVSTEQDGSSPPVAACAGCGLGFLVSELVGHLADQTHATTS